MFKLDNRIEQDSFLVKENNDFQIRLMDISEVFWVILIPKKSNLTELYELEINDRNYLLNFAIELGDYLKSKGRFDKTNIGLLMLLETSLGPFWVWLGTNETPNIYMIVGGVIVIFSLAWYILVDQIKISFIK